MQKASPWLLVFALSMLLSVLAVAEPQSSALATSAETTAAPSPEAPQAAQPAARAPAAKKPQPLFEYGFEERIRTEGYDNITDYNRANKDQRLQVRYRTRTWLSVPTRNVDFYLRLTNENRQYITPDDKQFVAPGSAALPGQTINKYMYDTDETVFDNLYLNFKKLPVPGLSLKVGRMDMTKGEAFLFGDPSAGDGSRTAYYNMVNLAYSFRKNKSKLELIGILNPHRERLLPTIGTGSPAAVFTRDCSAAITAPYKGKPRCTDRKLQEYDSQSVGLYYTDKNLKQADIEAYYFLVKESNDSDRVAATAYAFQPNRQLSVLGGRVVERPTKTLSVVGEFAGQWGLQHANNAPTNALLRTPVQDIRAWGGYAYVKKTFAIKMKPYVQVGYIALSGDDPNTKGKAEGFDPLYSRSPKWGDAMYYSLNAERGLGYWSNLKTPQIEAAFTPIKRVTVRSTYYRLSAFHPYPGNLTVVNGGIRPASTAATATFAPVIVNNMISGGTMRGNNVQVRTDVKLTSFLSGHFVYDHMQAGDFYKGENSGHFVRAEVVYTFKRGFLPQLTKK